MIKLIQSTYDVWKETNYCQILKDLDVIAAEISEEKNQGELSRKLLVEKNRKFKEQVSLEIRKEVAPLLKSFQTEVDNLSRRTKSLETHILILYKKFIDIPDPVPALEKALSSQKKLQKHQDILLENEKLRESIEEYHKEISDVKNQEVTVKNLRERVKELENQMMTSVNAKVEQREQELLNNYMDKERELNEEKLEMEEKMKDCLNKLNQSEKSMSDIQMELFQAKNKFDDLSSAKAAEIEILMSENDRMAERLKNMESQLKNETVTKEKVTSAERDWKQSNETDIEREINELRMELSSRDNELIKLNEEMRKERNSQLAAESKLNEEIHQLTEVIDKQNHSIADLQQKIDKQSDYNELKQELEVMKSIEFADVTSMENGASKSVEQLLMEKNRQMQSELLRERATNVSNKAELQRLSDKNIDMERINKEKSQLINRLEEDLHYIKSFSSKFRGAGEGSDDVKGGIIAEPQSTSAILANVVEGLTESDEISMDISDNQQSSLLDIVQSQRNRFKKRAQDLEALCQTYQLQTQSLEQDVERIKQDNIKLYQKIRFLQSTDVNRSGSGNSITINDSSDPTLSQYSHEYAARLNPFENFNRRERQRQYQILPIHEKIMFSLGKFIMGNRTARMVAFLYSLLLHFLIIVVLFKLAYSETCMRDQALACNRKFADHMWKAHGHK